MKKEKDYDMYSTLQGILKFNNKEAFYRFFHSLKNYEQSMTFDEFRETCIDEGKMEIRFMSGNAINNIHKLIFDKIIKSETSVVQEIDVDNTILRCFAEDIVSVFEIKSGRLQIYSQYDIPTLLDNTKFRKLFPTVKEYKEACYIDLDFNDNERDSAFRDLIDEWVAKVANFEEFNEIEFETAEDLSDDTKMQPEWIKFFEENHWLDDECKEYFERNDFLRIFYNSTGIPKGLFLKEICEEGFNTEIFDPEFGADDNKYQYEVYVIGSEGDGFLIITKL